MQFIGSNKYSVNFYRLIWDGNNRNDTNTIPLANNADFNSIAFKNIGNSSYGYFGGSGIMNFNNCTLCNYPSNFIQDDYGNCVMHLTNCYGGFTIGEKRSRKPMEL